MKSESWFCCLLSILVSLSYASGCGNFKSERANLECTALEQHNKIRGYHGSLPMQLDSETSDMAQMCADYYAERGLIDHSCTFKGGLGENLYFYKGRKGLSYAVNRAVRMWYSEVQMYSYRTHAFSFDIGHFTQVVWKNSTMLGLGYARNPGQKRDYIVCLYSPRGNTFDFPEQVPPLKKPVWMTSTEVGSRKGFSKKGIIHINPQ